MLKFDMLEWRRKHILNESADQGITKNFGNARKNLVVKSCTGSFPSGCNKEYVANKTTRLCKYCGAKPFTSLSISSNDSNEVPYYILDAGILYDENDKALPGVPQFSNVEEAEKYLHNHNIKGDVFDTNGVGVEWKGKPKQSMYGQDLGMKIR